MNIDQFTCKALSMNENEWVVGNAVAVTHGGIYSIKCFDSGLSLLVHKETICQYSGWNDSEDKPIFHGDRLELVNDEGGTIIVMCEYGKVERKLVSLSGDINTCEISGFYFRIELTDRITFPIVKNYQGVNDVTIMKVIGNVFDIKNISV